MFVFLIVMNMMHEMNMPWLNAATDAIVSGRDCGGSGDRCGGDDHMYTVKPLI